MAIYRVTIVGQVLTQTWNNVWYLSSNNLLEELQEDIDDIIEPYRTLGVAQWTNQCQLTHADVRGVDVLGSPTLTYLPTLGPVIGTVPDQVPSTQVALLVSFNALATKPNAVRKYMIGNGAGGLGADGLWNTAVITAHETWKDEMIDIGTGDPQTLFPLSVAFDESGVATEFNEMDTGVVQPVPATQRRRRIGVGI